MDLSILLRVYPLVSISPLQSPQTDRIPAGEHPRDPSYLAAWTLVDGPTQ